MTGASAAERRDQPAALEISAAVVAGSDFAHADVMRGSMRVETGELALIQVANLHQAEIWGDLAVGLVTPEQGCVSILGNDLSSLDLEMGDWLRGRIGRTFSRGGWLDRLSLMDNVLLQARHHSGRSDDELRREASALAQSFDMPGIPLGTPDRFARTELQRAACVRAFLGDPLLVILEDPTYAAHADILAPLMGAIRAVRDRGAAVLWFSPSMELWRDRTIPATNRYRMAGNELMEVASR
jgi:phospholipid/cholesterol/gamma-HCH transport system ATP-binding protein